MIRTTNTHVTFLHAFSLAGIGYARPAGTYVVETDEEQLQDLSFLAYKRVCTRITFATDKPGCTETAVIDPDELAMALADDAVVGLKSSAGMTE